MDSSTPDLEPLASPPTALAEAEGIPTVDSSAAQDGLPTQKPSYVKLAMRNMVRKPGQSLRHFGLTTIGLLALLVGLAYLTR